MDKLTLQTVYVPVEGDLDDRPVLCVWDDDNGEWDYQDDLQELPNVYTLTAEQLYELVEDAMNEAIVELPKSRNAWQRCVNDFLQSKGVTI